MKGLTCDHCGADTTNGLALCELCQAAARISLEFIPVHYRNLARWRPGRSGTARQVPGSRVLYDGTTRRADSTGDRIGDRLDEALTMLTTWARALADDRTFEQPLRLTDAVLAEDLDPETSERLVDHPEQTARLICQGLDQHLTSMATLPWCGELVRELQQCEQRLGSLTEDAIPGWYAGACQHRLSDDERCGTPTYVVPGERWTTCRSCGSASPARDHLEVLLDEARDWVASPRQLAEAVVALVDTEQSVPNVVGRIRLWAYRERITPTHHMARGYAYDAEAERMVVVDEPVGRARYRLGDVLELVWSGPRQRQSDRIGA